jgi:hypothetical protein
MIYQCVLQTVNPFLYIPDFCLNRILLGSTFYGEFKGSHIILKHRLIALKISGTPFFQKRQPLFVGLSQKDFWIQSINLVLYPKSVIVLSKFPDYHIFIKSEYNLLPND